MHTQHYGQSLFDLLIEALHLIGRHSAINIVDCHKIDPVDGLRLEFGVYAIHRVYLVPGVRFIELGSFFRDFAEPHFRRKLVVADTDNQVVA